MSALKNETRKVSAGGRGGSSRSRGVGGRQESQRSYRRQRSSSRDRDGRDHRDRRDYRSPRDGGRSRGDHMGRRRSSSSERFGRDYGDRRDGARYDGGRSRVERGDRSPAKRRREETPTGHRRDKRARARSPGDRRDERDGRHERYDRDGRDRRASPSRNQEKRREADSVVLSARTYAEYKALKAKQARV